jgi:hypothetical protein
MKRGFLNTQKAKQRVAEAIDVKSTGEPPHKQSKDKDTKEKWYIAIIDVKDTVKLSCRSSDSGMRAKYADFLKINPHKVPETFQEQVDNDKNCIGYGKNRIIFRGWPRDPKGDTITPSPLRGKEAGNGIDLWGATLYDFYHILRAPDVNWIAISTGSRLAKWMRQHGELIADNELYWADKEEDPKEVPVVDIGELIRCYDGRVALGIFNQFSSRKEIREKEKIGWSAFSYSNLEKTTDEGDSTPPVDDQGDQLTGKPVLPLPNIDLPFHPDHYPSPYPFIPCSHADEIPVLQQRIPLHLLPQKLHVHDPWDKLTIRMSDSDHKTPWHSKVSNEGDIVRTYSLSLTSEGKKAASKTQKLAQMAEAETAKEESVLHIFPTDKEGPTEEPLIEVVLPLRPQKRMQVEEAHLYLSPRTVGVGHHSIVHSVEWELPRDLFMDASLCKACVEEDVDQQVQKSKYEGEWEMLLKDPAEKPEETTQGGPPGGEPSQASGPKQTAGHVTIKEHPFAEVTGSFVLGRYGDVEPDGEKFTNANEAPSSNRDSPVGTASDAATGGAETDVQMDAIDGQDLKLGAKVDQEEAPDVDMEIDNDQPCALGSAPKEDKGKGKMEPEQDNGGEERNSMQNENEQSEKCSEEETFTLEPPRIIRIPSYSGPVLRIHTTVKWRSPWEEQCDHGSPSFGSGPVPCTAVVGVVAKLSFEHDLHLAREAANYQSFPDHFFQHWNGYNVISPIQDPVPVGALCPQFYGYYRPDDPTDSKYSHRPRYLSPILLLEHCGREIDPNELCQDDKQECASLMLRFHHAGWLHESFAARNILWQQGKPTERPIDRPHSGKSFRLIDFGRSKKSEPVTMMLEGERAFRLLHLLHHAKLKTSN